MINEDSRAGSPGFYLPHGFFLPPPPLPAVRQAGVCCCSISDYRSAEDLTALPSHPRQTDVLEIALNQIAGLF